MVFFIVVGAFLALCILLAEYLKYCAWIVNETDKHNRNLKYKKEHKENV